MNSYWNFWIGGRLWRFSVSSFCDFLNMNFWDFTAFSPLWHKETYGGLFQMCFIKEYCSLFVSNAPEPPVQ